MPRIDVAPDGATDDGPWFGFDPESLANRPLTWSLTVDGWSSASVEFAAAGGSQDATLLAFYPDNRFENDAGQLQVLVPGELGPPIGAIFVPRVDRP